MVDGGRGRKGHGLSQRQKTPNGTEEEYVVSRGLRRVTSFPSPPKNKKQKYDHDCPLQAIVVNATGPAGASLASPDPSDWESLSTRIR